MSNSNGVNSWSPSRLEKYEQCPLLFKLDILQKLCPACFKGKLMGEFGSPLVCDACGVKQAIPAPIARGSEIGETLEKYVLGKAPRLHTEIRHETVLATAKTLRTEYKRSKGTTVRAELSLNFGKDWQLIPEADGRRRWREIWLRTKLDVWRLAGKVAHVIDWKTGGIDKRTGEVRAAKKYDDQLAIYSLATLLAFPQVEEVRAALVFVDCGPRFDPVIERGSMKPVSIKKEQRRWELRVRPLFADNTFAPRASDKCRWCSYRKEEGGPCPY